MEYKRLTLVCGHYGSGKTNVAVNFASDLKKRCSNTAIADLDIVNPYFRTKDSREELEKAGIELICSEYAGTNIDIPAMPQQMYSITDDRTKRVIIDVGGDDRGALALGRLAPAIAAENDYEMLLVINCYRPLTRDAASTASVNNSNLGGETTREDILASLEYAEEVSRLSSLPIKCTTVHDTVYGSVAGEINNLFPLKLQPKID